MTAEVPPPEQMRCGVWFFPNRPAPELVEAIVVAERLGLDEVWLGDEGPAREPFAVLAAAAVRTSSIRLGIGVTNPYVRHPALAVASAATIAELAPGRVALGVGAGGSMSLDPFELEATAPLAAVTDMIEVARASIEGRDATGYRASDLAVAKHAPPVPVWIGARGPKLNRLASERADGAFVAGLAPFRYDEVIGWVRSHRPIDVALYPSVAFDDTEREQHRPEMIWSLLDAPPAALESFGLDAEAVQHAADGLRRGDAEPARRLIDDEVLDELMVIGPPTTVGTRLADLVDRHAPTSVGLAIIADDLPRSIDRAAEAFGHMRMELAAASGRKP